MRLTKEVKVVLFDKVNAYKDEASKKYPDIATNVYSDILATFRDLKNEKLQEIAKEAIKQVCKKYNRTYPNIDTLVYNLVKENNWTLSDECILPEDTANKEARDLIYKQTEIEKQNLILKIPFLKKEEELNAYMKGIEERLNAI